MITKNFKLNALANQFSTAVYDHVTTTNGGDNFMINAAGVMVRVDIIGGAKGVRDLIDGFVLEALKEAYPQWESIAIALLRKCVNSAGLTEHGREIWESVVGDMGATVGGDYA
ncbi:hypothetical protein [Hafnia paralvei]|uniref:hypothetical protein n=1 Tax=Hafnia paralvei TaxID=546367 RepID=UPI00266C94C5|nr:hypothetical protein [Hafnia paralvei]